MTNTPSNTSPAVSPPASASPSTQAGGIFKAAMLIAGVTIVSKLLGAVRDWLILFTYGASITSDAYFAAVQIPSFALILLGGLGGPFHTATVAVVGRIINQHQDGASEQAKTEALHKARLLTSTFLTLTGLVFLVLSFATAIWAEPFFNLIFTGSENAALVHLAAEQMQIMSPILLIGGLVGIFYGVLNVYQQFLWPSLSPGVMNVVMIAALLLFPNDETGHLLAWSTLGGAIGQFLVQLPGFWREKFSIRPTLAGLKLPEMRQLGEILFPACLSTTVGQAMTYVDMAFAGLLQSGGWTAVVMSNRLLQLPIGVLQTALLVPIFPRFTQWVAQENWDALRRDFRLGVSTLWLISFPILVVLLFYCEPLVRLAFEHGAFTTEDTQLVSLAVVFQAFQMVAYFARDSLTRVFFAFHDSKTPFWVGVIAIGIKAILDYTFVVVFPFGVGGIALATTCITFINWGLLSMLSKRHIADLGMKPLIKTFTRLLLAAGVMGLAFWLTQQWAGYHWLSGLIHSLNPALDAIPPKLWDGLVVLVYALLGTCLYIVAALMLRVPETWLLLDRLDRQQRVTALLSRFRPDIL